MIVTNSFAINTVTAGFQAHDAAGITVNHSVSAFNSAGVQTGGIGAGAPTATVSDSEISNCTTGFVQTLGTINTFGNNRMHDNGSKRNHEYSTTDSLSQSVVKSYAGRINTSLAFFLTGIK